MMSLYAIDLFAAPSKRCSPACALNRATLDIKKQQIKHQYKMYIKY